MPGLCPTADLFAYRKEGVVQPLAGKQSVCQPGYEHQEMQLSTPYDYCTRGLWMKTQSVSTCKSKAKLLNKDNFNWNACLD